MPIKDLTENVRLPRLGKIHLGTKHPEKGYPMKADHFVLPVDHADYGELVKVFGTVPTELRILIPVEDEEAWASQYYKSYNLTYGLVCKGDGESAMRMLDVKTNQLPKADTPGTVKMQEMLCLGRGCPDYKNKEKGKPQCHEVMNLRFILPEIPGLGAWQIDTGSKNSILNINNSARIIKRAFGRISMIPLKLTFEPQQVNIPETGKKQTVYVLNLRTDVTLAQLADAAREQSRVFALDMPSLEDAYELEVAEDIAGLWGDGEQVTEPEPEYINPELEEGLNSEGLTLKPQIAMATRAQRKRITDLATEKDIVQLVLDYILANYDVEQTSDLTSGQAEELLMEINQGGFNN